MEHFRVPFVHNVFQRVGAIDGEANEDEVGFGIGEGTEAVVFLLASGVPKGKLDGFVGRRVMFLGNVIFKNGGNVALLRVHQQV